MEEKKDSKIKQKAHRAPTKSRSQRKRKPKVQVLAIDLNHYGALYPKGTPIMEVPNMSEKIKARLLENGVIV